MPSQDDLINENLNAMAVRAAKRKSGELPGRVVPLSRAQCLKRMNVMQEEIDRLRLVPSDVTSLRAELASTRAAHRDLLNERDSLSAELDTTRAELATVRASISPA